MSPTHVISRDKALSRWQESSIGGFCPVEGQWDQPGSTDLMFKNLQNDFVNKDFWAKSSVVHL